MKRRRLEGDEQSALVDSGILPSDNASLAPCPLVIHTWCDIDNMDSWQECCNRVKWYDRWRVTSQIVDNEVWSSIGCFTAESQNTQFLEPAWLPPVAACVVRDILRHLVGYISVDLLDMSDALCLVPPPYNPARALQRLPLRLVVYTVKPGGLINRILIERDWMADVPDPLEEIESGRLVVNSLTPHTFSTNLFARDCLLSFASESHPAVCVNPNINCICAFPSDSATFDSFKADSDETTQIYEIQAESLQYAWSSLPAGTSSFSTLAASSVPVYSAHSDTPEAVVSVALAKHSARQNITPMTLDELDLEELPSTRPYAGRGSLNYLGEHSPERRDSPDFIRRPQLFSSPPGDNTSPEIAVNGTVIELDSTSSASIMEIGDDDDCEITEIKKLKDLTSLFADHICEHGWGDLLAFARPWLNSINTQTLRFENNELFNDESEEWLAHKKLNRRSIEASRQFYDKVLLSRIIHLMLYGHLMNYSQPLVLSDMPIAGAINELKKRERETQKLKVKIAPCSALHDKEDVVVVQPSSPSSNQQVEPVKVEDALVESPLHDPVGTRPPSNASSSGPSFETAISRKCDDVSKEDGLPDDFFTSSPLHDDLYSLEFPDPAYDLGMGANLSHEFGEENNGDIGHPDDTLEDEESREADPLLDLLDVGPAPASDYFDSTPGLPDPVEDVFNTVGASQQSVEAETVDPALASSETIVKAEGDVDSRPKEEFLDEQAIRKGLNRDYDNDPELAVLTTSGHRQLKLNCKLFPHQLEAIKWMIRRERDGVKYEDGYFVRPKVTNQNMEESVFDLAASDYKPKKKLDKVRGGILADEMGLGKTLQSIVTVLLDPYSAEHISSETLQFDDRDTRKGCTLVVCPLSVIGNWRNSINDFTSLPDSAVAVYHGPSKAKLSATDLAKKLFVITSYASLLTVKASTSGGTDLHKIHWRRVILDEGHEIRNPRAKRTKAVLQLIYDIGWIVTGTPLQNSLTDIQPLLTFLKVKHLDIPSIRDAQTPITPPLIGASSADEVIVAGASSMFNDAQLTTFLRFTFALRTMILRRTKASINALKTPAGEAPGATPGAARSAASSPASFTPRFNSETVVEKPSLALPEKTFVELRIPFEGTERERYNAFKIVTRMLARQVEGQFIMLNTLVTHMRLLSGSQAALGPIARRALEEAYRIMKGDDKELENVMTKAQIEQVLQSAAVRELARCDSTNLTGEGNGSETVCPICYDGGVDCITQCAHPFHRVCIIQWFANTTDRSCPYCRKSISEKNLLNLTDIKAYQGEAKHESTEQDQTVTASAPESSKVKTVVEHIAAQIRQGHPPGVKPGPVKVVVFSSFVRMLRLLQEALRARNIESILFTGDLNRNKREKLINEFQRHDTSQVFLSSYGAGSTGVTLTAANLVYLLDPWWNPFTEDQAVDRVHRISQTRPVTVYRVVMDESIEEGVIECQQKKRIISQKIVGAGGTAKVTANATVHDLEDLLAR